MEAFLTSTSPPPCLYRQKRPALSLLDPQTASDLEGARLGHTDPQLYNLIPSRPSSLNTERHKKPPCIWASKDSYGKEAPPRGIFPLESRLVGASRAGALWGERMLVLQPGYASLGTMLPGDGEKLPRANTEVSLLLH